VFSFGAGIAADQVTIQGQVNEDNQLVDEQGTVYDIADTEEGLKVKEMIGDKVEVRGTLMDNEGAKEITVESFNIVN
jgi:hypothetical protein